MLKYKKKILWTKDMISECKVRLSNELRCESCVNYDFCDKVGDKEHKKSLGVYSDRERKGL